MSLVDETSQAIAPYWLEQAIAGAGKALREGLQRAPAGLSDGRATLCPHLCGKGGRSGGRSGSGRQGVAACSRWWWGLRPGTPCRVLLVLVLWPLRGSACPPPSPGSLRETARS